MKNIKIVLFQEEHFFNKSDGFGNKLIYVPKNVFVEFNNDKVLYNDKKLLWKQCLPTVNNFLNQADKHELFFYINFLQYALDKDNLNMRFYGGYIRFLIIKKQINKTK